MNILKHPGTSWTAGLRDLNPDGWLLVASYAVRSLAYGFLAVVLGLYLDSRGLPPAVIGGIFTSALVGGTILTAIVANIADRVGRRRMLRFGAALMVLGSAIFALADNLILLALGAVLGTLSPSGREVGPFRSIEEAILPQTTSGKDATSVFAGYNLAGSLAGAFGALAVGVPGLLGLVPPTSYRVLLWAYVAAGVVLLLLYMLLSSAVEAQASLLDAGHVRPGKLRPGSAWLGVQQSRGIVARLAALFAIDSFASGFVVQGLVAYWFHLRYGVGTDGLGATFFGANLLSALSVLAAPRIVARVGPLKAMVFSHLPGNVLLLLVPLMPSLELAIGVFLARYLFAQIDRPVRQSYTMAIVGRSERSGAAGIFSVVRTGAQAIAPAMAGATLALPGLGLPFLVAGGLKIVYDLALLFWFRNVRPS